MIDRILEKELRYLSTIYPVVTIMGPRQSGKTTLAKLTFPELPYINFEDPFQRTEALKNPRTFLEHYPDGAILDEIQNVPIFMSYIQVIVDERKKNGQFILTGSHNLMLHRDISQSLAGRTGILRLLPLSIVEISNLDTQYSPEEYMLKGGYPKIYSHDLPPGKVYQNYFETYVDRDVRQLNMVKHLNEFTVFMKLLAGRVGQLLNLDNLSIEVGVSAKTLKEWISILEASFVIVLLRPYHENFGKRLIKSAKVYFVDTGLASYLLAIETVDQMRRDPLRGHLFENLMVTELLKAQYNVGRRPTLYFWRDRTGHEIDVLYKHGHELVPIEIKSGTTYQTQYTKNLEFFDKLAGDRCPKQYLIFTGIPQFQMGKVHKLNFMDAAKAVLNPVIVEDRPL